MPVSPVLQATSFSGHDEKSQHRQRKAPGRQTAILVLATFSDKCNITRSKPVRCRTAACAVPARKATLPVAYSEQWVAAA